MTIKISQLGNIAGVSDGTYFAAVDTSSIFTSVKSTGLQLKNYIQGSSFGNILPNTAANINATLGTNSNKWYNVYSSNVAATYVTANIGVFTSVDGLLTTAAQTNITSLGTIAALNAGTVYATGAVQTTSGFIGDGSQITNINGANISSGTFLTVGNLTYLNVAGNTKIYSNLIITSANVSVSSSTGAFVVAGGAGVGKDLYVGAGIFGPTITLLNSNVTLANTGIIGYIGQQVTNANTGVIGYFTTANTGTIGYIGQQVTGSNLALKGYVDFANSIQSAQITAANIGIIGYIGQQVTNANIGQIGFTNNQITLANTGVVGYVGQQVTNANTGVIGYFTTANTGTIGYIGQQVTNANTGIKGYTDLANTIQSSQITAANLGIIGYVNNQVITTTQVGILANLNVTNGAGAQANISIANIGTLNATSLTVAGNLIAGNGNVILSSAGYLYNAPNYQQGLVQAQQIFVLANPSAVGGNISVAGTTGDQTLFNQNVFLAGSTIYEFSTVFNLARAAISTNPHVVSLNLGQGGTGGTYSNIAGMAAVNGVLYEFSSQNGYGATWSNIAGQSQSAGNLIITGTIATTAPAYIWVRASGIIGIGTAGWIRPSLSFSAPSSANYWLQAGSYFKISPLASTGANVSVGSWRVT